MSDRWELADEADLPKRFTDPRLDEFLYVSSCGWEGIRIGDAFMHKPSRYPQCFPHGEDGDAICTTVLLRRQASDPTNAGGDRGSTIS
jgi:hypothetical protein